MLFQSNSCFARRKFTLVMFQQLEVSGILIRHLSEMKYKAVRKLHGQKFNV